MADALQRLNPAENTVLGVAVALCDVSTTQWMLYCKNATQQGLPLSLNPWILYRGALTSFANMSILSGLQFPLTGLVNNFVTGGTPRRLTDAEQIGSGFIGGVISGVVCAPMELVMVQQQRTGASLMATPGTIVAQTGYSGMFRGLWMSCGREGIFTAGMLGLGPTIKRYAAEEFGCTSGTSSLVGAVGGGVIVASLSHPMDTIKTCQQGDILREKYGSVFHTGRTLLTESGFTRFFSGWSWRTGRMVLQTFLFGECKTHLSPIFFPHHFQD